MTILLTAPSSVSTRPRPLPRSRLLSRTIAFALFLSAALVGIEIWQMWHVRDASLRSAKIVTASLAESLSQQIETTFKTADTVVASLVQQAETDGVNPDSMLRLYGTMTSLAAALPAIHEMGLTDKDGNAIVKSLVPRPIGMNYRERDYFRHHQNRNTRDVFVGQPVRSKVDGTANITVSRRVNDRKGNFAGVVVTSVSMDFFRKLFESVRDRSGRSIAMVSDDGMLLAASPALFGDAELAALNAASGIEYRSPIDDIDRVGSAKHLAHYPMTVVVAEDSSAILGDWYNQLQVHGTIVLCILAVIGVLGYRVDQANRAARIQALRDGLTGLANRHDACPQGVVTLSAGIACWRTGQPATASWLVEMSDTALYAAKANGRDTFTVHPSAAGRARPGCLISRDSCRACIGRARHGRPRGR